MYNEKKINKADKRSARQYLTFEIGRENYGLELTKAKEIIKPPKITNVPNSEKYILGVINLRGQVIPVIDMNNKLGLNDMEKSNMENKRIIVINIQNMLIGLYVDNVKEVIKLTDDEIEDVSESKKGIRQEYITGVSIIGESLIIIINLDNLLFDREEKKGA